MNPTTLTVVRCECGVFFVPDSFQWEREQRYPFGNGALTVKAFGCCGSIEVSEQTAANYWPTVFGSGGSAWV